MDEVKKSFEQLVEEKAGCFEFAWNGYIRLYEEGEKKCECKDCQAFDQLKKDFDKIYTRVPIDMFFVKQCYLNEPIVCKKCEKEPIECECLHA